MGNEISWNNPHVYEILQLLTEYRGKEELSKEQLYGMMTGHKQLKVNCLRWLREQSIDGSTLQLDDDNDEYLKDLRFVYLKRPTGNVHGNTKWVCITDNGVRKYYELKRILHPNDANDKTVTLRRTGTDAIPRRTPQDYPINKIALILLDSAMALIDSASERSGECDGPAPMNDGDIGACSEMSDDQYQMYKLTLIKEEVSTTVGVVDRYFCSPCGNEVIKDLMKDLKDSLIWKGTEKLENYRNPLTADLVLAYVKITKEAITRLEDAMGCIPLDDASVIEAIAHGLRPVRVAAQDGPFFPSDNPEKCEVAACPQSEAAANLNGTTTGQWIENLKGIEDIEDINTIDPSGRLPQSDYVARNWCEATGDRFKVVAQDSDIIDPSGRGLPQLDDGAMSDTGWRPTGGTQGPGTRSAGWCRSPSPKPEKPQTKDVRPKWRKNPDA